ncbi:hypothetical protein FACS1894122_00330 [Alphaproteobacteria bacterium]|nr:hypothetical protein FACS1894122_00050 [Alphaproteobacteria bacterium]GHT90345.1 hypothetical protein FACS1894122_00330 [Alphaproteobacteria bacterium]
MKRLMIGSAVAIMLVANVVDVNAWPFGTGSGQSDKKTSWGHNNKDTVKMLGSYYKSSTDDATEAIGITRKFYDGLNTLNTTTKKKHARTISSCRSAWQKVDIALESIQHKRKVDDIVPDCKDALNAVVKSTSDLAALVGEEAFKPLRKLFEKWPSAPDASSSSDKSGAAKAIYDLYEAIQGLAEPIVFNRKTVVSSEIPRLTTPIVSAGGTITIPPPPPRRAPSPRLTTPIVSAGGTITIPPPPPRRTSSSDVDYSHNLYDESKVLSGSALNKRIARRNKAENDVDYSHNLYGNGSRIPPQFLPPGGVSPNRNSSNSAPPPLPPHPYAKIMKAVKNSHYLLDDDDDDSAANAADSVSPPPSLSRSSSAPPQPLNAREGMPQSSHRRSASAGELFEKLKARKAANDARYAAAEQEAAAKKAADPAERKKAEDAKKAADMLAAGEIEQATAPKVCVIGGAAPAALGPRLAALRAQIHPDDEDDDNW